MSAANSSRLRLFFALGPGDLVKAYEDWRGGVRTRTETSITYSSQTFEFARQHGIAFHAVAANARTASVEEGGSRIENRPKGSGPVSGLAFHLRELRYAASLWRSARAFGATHAVVDTGTSHWFALLLFNLSGIAVIPNYHNVYWPVGHPPKGALKRLLFGLDRLYYRLFVRQALGVSPECGRQIGLLSGGRCQYFDYRIQFSPDDFADMPRPSLQAPLQLLFVGRIERNKGVFDLLAMCKSIQRRGGPPVHLDICGSGAAQAELAAAIEAEGLQSTVQMHGKLERARLLGMYARCHVVVVPTRSDFCEGLPGVCVEAMLAGRPVVTSSLSNALELLGAAMVEARQDDPEDYAAKIVELAADPRRYDALCARTTQVVQPFVDGRLGLTRMLQACLLPGPAARQVPAALPPST